MDRPNPNPTPYPNLALDRRRNTKPKKAAVQLQVCTPFDPAGFHFGKIRNEGERLLRLRLAGGEYQLLTNKFPLFPSHMLLVASEEVPQQLTLQHLEAVTQLVTATSAFCAYFNSWRASAQPQSHPQPQPQPQPQP